MKNFLLAVALTLLFTSLGYTQNFWQQTNGPFGGIIRSLAINSSGNVFASTYGSGVFKSINSTTGIEEDNSLPKEFALYQNYPNPFNPSTVIRYSIPTPDSPPFTKGGKQGGSLVSLIVYDILGNEVATLVNEEKQPGSYQVEFNAAVNGAALQSGVQYASGVYFYQLKTDGYTETKKMVFLK
jgi:hypothetical protein